MIRLFNRCSPYEGGWIDSFEFSFRLHNDWTWKETGLPTASIIIPEGPFSRYLNYEAQNSLNSYALNAVYLDGKPKPGIWEVTYDQVAGEYVTPEYFATYGDFITHDYRHTITIGGDSFAAVTGGIDVYERTDHDGTTPPSIHTEFEAEAYLFPCACFASHGLGVGIERSPIGLVGWSMDITIAGEWVSDFPP